MPPKKKEEEIDPELLPQMEYLSILLNFKLPEELKEKQFIHMKEMQQENIIFLSKSNIINKAIELKIYIDPNTLNEKQKKDINNLPVNLTQEILCQSFDELIKEKVYQIKKKIYLKNQEKLKLENEKEKDKDKKKKKELESKEKIEIPQILDENKILLILEDYPQTEEEFVGLKFSKEKPLDIFLNINYSVKDIPNKSDTISKSRKFEKSYKDFNNKQKTFKDFQFSEEEKYQMNKYETQYKIAKNSLKNMDKDNYGFNIIFKNINLEANINDIDSEIKSNSNEIIDKINFFYEQLKEYENWEKDKNKIDFYNKNQDEKEIDKNKLMTLYKKQKNNSKNIFEIMNKVFEIYEKEENKNNENESSKKNELEIKLNTIDDLFNNFKNNLSFDTNDKNENIENINNNKMNDNLISIAGIDRYNMPLVNEKSKLLRIKESRDLLPIYNCNQMELLEKLNIYNFQDLNKIKETLLDKNIIKFLSKNDYYENYINALKLNLNILSQYNSIDDSLLVYFKKNNDNLNYYNYESKKDIEWSIYPNRNNWFKYFKNNKINSSKINFYNDLNCENFSNIYEINNYIYTGDESLIYLSKKKICSKLIYQNLFQFKNLEFGFKEPNKSKLNSYELVYQYEVEPSEESIKEEDKKKKKGKNEPVEKIIKPPKIIKEYDRIERGNQGEFWFKDSNNLKVYTTYERYFKKIINDDINHFDDLLINKYGIQKESEYLMTTNLLLSNNNLIKCMANGDFLFKNSKIEDEKYRIINRNGSITKYMKNGKIIILFHNGNIAESEGNNIWLCTNNKGIRWKENIITKEKIELEPFLITKRHESAENQYPEVWLREDGLIKILYENNSFILIHKDKTKVFNKIEINEIIIEHPDYQKVNINLNKASLNENINLKNNRIEIFLEDGTLIESYIGLNEKIYSFIKTNFGNLLYFDNIKEIVVIPYNNRLNFENLKKELELSENKTKMLVEFVLKQINEINSIEKMSLKKFNKNKNTKQKDILQEKLEILKLEFLENLKKLTNDFKDDKDLSLIIKKLNSVENESEKKINFINENKKINLKKIKKFSESKKFYEIYKNKILEIINNSNKFYINEIFNKTNVNRSYGIYSIDLIEKKLYTQNNIGSKISYDSKNNIDISSIKFSKVENIINDIIALKNSGVNTNQSEKSSRYKNDYFQKIFSLFKKNLNLIFDFKPKNDLYIIYENNIKQFICEKEYNLLKNLMKLLCLQFKNKINIDNNIGKCVSFILDENKLMNNKINEIFYDDIKNNNLMINYDKDETINFDENLVLINYFIREKNISNEDFITIYNNNLNKENEILNLKTLNNNEKYEIIKKNYENKLISLNNRQIELIFLNKKMFNESINKNYDSIIKDNKYYESLILENENKLKSISRISEDNKNSIYYKQDLIINEIILSKEKYLEEKLKEKKLLNECNRFLNLYFLTVEGKYFIENKEKEQPPFNINEEHKEILKNLEYLGRKDISEDNVGEEEKENAFNVGDNYDNQYNEVLIKKENEKNYYEMPKMISITKLLKKEEEKRIKEEKLRIKKFFDLKKKDYNVYGDKRKKLPKIPVLNISKPIEENNKKYIEIEAPTDIRVKTCSQARKLNIQAPSTFELRNQGNHKILMKTLDKGNTDYGIKLKLMSIGAKYDNLQKYIHIYPDNLNFGIIKKNKFYGTKLIIRNEDNLKQIVNIKNNNQELKVLINLAKRIKNNENKIQILKLDKSIAPGMSRELIVGFNTHNIKEDFYKESFQIITKYKIYTIPITAYFENEEETYKIKSLNEKNISIKEINKEKFDKLGDSKFSSNKINIEYTKTESDYMPKNNFNRNTNLSTLKENS